MSAPKKPAPGTAAAGLQPGQRFRVAPYNYHVPGLISIGGYGPMPRPGDVLVPADALDEVVKQEQERYRSVVAAARFLLGHSDWHPIRPSAQRSSWDALARSLAVLEDSDA